MYDIFMSKLSNAFNKNESGNNNYYPCKLNLILQ